MSAPKPKPKPTDRQRPQVNLVLSSVLIVYLGQQTLNPIIAPLARALHLAEWQLGLTISVAAIMVAVTSQFWGQRTQSWGYKTVLLSALVIAGIAMALFTLMAYLGMRGVIAGGALFAFFVLLRGVAFGTAIAAIPPTAQAYISEFTLDEATRVKGMARLSAVQGISMVLGAVLGGALSAFGLIAPILVVPVLLFVGLLMVAIRLRRQTSSRKREDVPRISFRDNRVWPYLLAGFGVFSALGFAQMTIGFLIQDRLHLDPQTTGVHTGGAILTTGIGMIIAQRVVSGSTWGPGGLLRRGGCVAAVGFALLVPDGGIVLLHVSMLLTGIGIGTAMPGYVAGATLAVQPAEQGGLAGLIGAVNGLTFVIAPIGGGVMYGIWYLLPAITGTVLMVAITLFVFVHPRFRRRSEATT